MVGGVFSTLKQMKAARYRLLELEIAQFSLRFFPVLEKIAAQLLKI